MVVVVVALQFICVIIVTIIGELETSWRLFFPLPSGVDAVDLLAMPWCIHSYKHLLCSFCECNISSIFTALSCHSLCSSYSSILRVWVLTCADSDPKPWQWHPIGKFDISAMCKEDLIALYVLIVVVGDLYKRVTPDACLCHSCLLDGD